MKLIANVIAIIVLVVGALLLLEGANVIAGTGMSGQSQWLWVGVVLILAGLAGLWRVNRRRARG